MDLFRIKKSIKIFMCSVLTIVVMATGALSFSFNSNAMAMPVNVGSYEFLSSLYSLLLSGKMVTDTSNNPFRNSYITEDIDDVMSFFDACNEYQEGLGDNLKSAVFSGALNGSLTLTAQDRADFLEYLEYCKTNSISVPISKYHEEYNLNAANYETHIIVRWHTASNPTIQQDDITITASQNYFLGLYLDTNAQHLYHFKIIPRGNSYPNVTINSTSYSTRPSRTGTEGGINTYTGAYLYFLNYNSGREYIYDSFDVYTMYWPGFGRKFSNEQLTSIIASVQNVGKAIVDYVDEGTFLSSTSDVISPTSTVTEEGDIDGNFVISVPDYQKIVQIFDAVKSGILNIKDALASLRLSTVSDDATVQEKEKAIQDLAEVFPASSITDSQTGTITVPAGATTTVSDSVDEMSAVQHITHSIANTIADIRDVPRPYPDEDPDVGPSGDPYLDGWEFPSLDPDNPDPGGTDPDSTEDANRAADVVNGLAFVSGFIGSFYNASKGYNMVFTVGISFVIFSVIIGASHFFGAMFGSHVSVNGPYTIKELNASRESQIRVQQRAYQKSLKQKRLTG